MNKLKSPKKVTVPMRGGLDVVSPQDMITPGRPIKAINFEPNLTGGYRRIQGFRRTAGGVIPANVQVVPGTGPVLGEWYYKGELYAFRATGSGTVKMFKGSGDAGTWAEVPFLKLLKFDHGTFREGDIIVGDIVTGKTSGTAGTIKNLIVNNGTYGQNASGYAVVDVTGSGFVYGEALEKTAGHVGWTALNSLPVAVRHHATTMLPDGRIVNTGGTNGAALASTSVGVYTSGAVTWTTSTDLPEARYGHTLTTLDSSRILVTGGSVAYGTTFTCVMGIISGNAIRWVASTPLLTARTNHAATLLTDGRIFVCGGQDVNGGVTAECMIGVVDGTGVKWSQATAMPDFLYGHTVSMIGEMIIVCGGKNDRGIQAACYIGLITGNEILWAQTNSLPVPLYEHTTNTFNSIAGVVCGGRTTGEVPSSVVYFGGNSNDTTNHTVWLNIAAMPTVRSYHTSVLLPNLNVMFMGGNGTSDVLTSSVNVGAVSGGSVATCSENQSNIAITASNNKFKFTNHNFLATSGGFNMYGCDGVNPAFEYDGTTFTPILMPDITGAPASNAPKRIAAHNNYLWLGFPQGSLQKSVLGRPLVWSGFLGAAEYGVGYEITDIVSMLDSSLMVCTEKNILTMQGMNETDFSLRILSDNTACLPGTAVVSVRPVVTTAKGIARMDATQSYGNFSSMALSRFIDPLLTSMLATKTLVGCSINRSKNQYRIYFSDGTGIIMLQDAAYIDQQLPEFTTFDYGIGVSSVASILDDSNIEKVVFGGTDGYVYEEFITDSFAGSPIPALLVLPFMSLGSKDVRKTFKWAEFDIEGSGTTDLTMSYCLSDGQAHTSREPKTLLSTTGFSTTWSESNWDGQTVPLTSVDQQIISMDGTGHTVALAFSSNSATAPPFLISNVTFTYFPRRLNRG